MLLGETPEQVGASSRRPLYEPLRTKRGPSRGSRVRRLPPEVEIHPAFRAQHRSPGVRAALQVPVGEGRVVVLVGDQHRPELDVPEAQRLQRHLIGAFDDHGVRVVAEHAVVRRDSRPPAAPQTLRAAHKRGIDEAEVRSVVGNRARDAARD
eukprot:CAMPEP_0180119340 /NCGR_PEP_ID=MMETSP0986-20121125/1937_1 /TAXON_ID=697907 /ORGANISM="non described non described, Strain CCMP2293" /LENGTH=151 /DNA_ID=CAMNT_0022058349 /DNA_START=271 /DNA_END=724 /DNA_ORIENTATION=+